MKISQIKENLRNINIEAKVVEKGEEKFINTRYGRKRLCEFLLEDESGKIVLVLWEENIDKIKVGDKIRIYNAYSTRFKDKLQLNLGRRGKIEIIE